VPDGIGDSVEVQSESVEAMWVAFLSACPDLASPGDGYSAWHFCDNQADADELAELVRAGRKRATAGPLWSYEAEGEPLPKIGDVSVITDWAGEACCVIRTISVEVVAYDDVSEEFAATEGEGDRSLSYWRKVHWAAFTRSLEEIDKVPMLDMPVVCERFEVVFGAAKAEPAVVRNLETIKFGGWVAQVDVKANRDAYSQVPLSAGDVCGCLECRNFEAARAKGLVYPKEVLVLFKRMGVNPARESEVYGMGLSREYRGHYLFGGWFNVVGVLLGEDVPAPDSVTPKIQLFPMHDAALPDPAFGEAPMFRIEFVVALPWLLDEPHWETARRGSRKK